MERYQGYMCVCVCFHDCTCLEGDCYVRQPCKDRMLHYIHIMWMSVGTMNGRPQIYVI